MKRQITLSECFAKKFKSDDSNKGEMISDESSSKPGTSRCSDSPTSSSKPEVASVSGPKIAETAEIQPIGSVNKNIELEQGSNNKRMIQNISACINLSRFEKWKQLRAWLSINDDNNIVCEICSKVKTLGLHKDKTVHFENAFIEGVLAKSRKKIA